MTSDPPASRRRTTVPPLDERFLIDAETWDALRRLLGAPKGSPKETAARADTEVWLGRYLSAVGRLDHVPRAADRRAALERIGEAAQALLQATVVLNTLPSAVVVLDAERANLGAYFTPTHELTAEMLALREAARRAAARYADLGSRGRPPRNAAAWAAVGLARVFEEHGTRGARAAEARTDFIILAFGAVGLQVNERTLQRYLARRSETTSISA